VGFLRPGSSAETGAYVAAFGKGLRETGYEQGKNVLIEYRFAEGEIDRLPALAKDLVKAGVKVIAAGGPPSVFAAAAATSTIPVVAAGFSDATLTLIGNINHPQGNVTGFSTFENAAMHGKRLELLRELIPSAATVAMLSHPGDAVDSGADVKDIVPSARALGMTLSAMTAENDAEIEAAFKAATDERADALLITGAPFFTVRHDRIVALAARYHLPAIYPWREYAAAGGLIAYASSLTAVWRGAGQYVGKILSGATPGELPVQQPTTFELVINLKTAAALGLTIPPTLLARADEVIE
jgi:putative ABC transport system substrate-binding protein